MENNTKELEIFRAYLHDHELSGRTQEIYLQHTQRFLEWLEGRH